MCAEAAQGFTGTLESEEIQGFMSSTTGEPSVAAGSSGNQGQSFLPWNLIPSFTPGSTDISDYSRRLQFLAGIWPKEHLPLLAPRAALQCEGSALQKLIRLDTERLKTSDDKGVRLIVQTLGGVWGKTLLEDKYEKFEKALFGTSQRQDESNESYLARHEILFEDLLGQNVTLTDVRSYILLRNSSLSSEDNKKVIVDAKGDLKYDAVTSAIRLLGSKFFGEVQGQSKVTKKQYEVNYAQENEEENPIVDDQIFVSEGLELSDQLVEHFAAEGDEDALVVHQFEESLIDFLQGDDEMSILLTAYADARRRLAEKSKGRGIWPIKGSGAKGKGKSKFQKFRKPLSQRIAESECRICGRRGHWKRECPFRNSGPPNINAGKPQSANALILDDEDGSDLLIDFVHPDFEEPGSQDRHFVADPSVAHFSFDHCDKDIDSSQDCYMIESVLLKSVVKHVKTKVDNQVDSPTAYVSDPKPFHSWSTEKIKQKFQQIHQRRRMHLETPLSKTDSLKAVEVQPSRVVPSEKTITHVPHMALFASHNAVGIVDSGASQTIMGSHQEAEFLSSLPAEARARSYESPAQMSFRFGNNSTVTCNRALVVPIGPVWIKIAIVETRTPFLISNNVLRQLGAVIDTEAQSIHFKRLQCTVPLSLTDRKLFTLDIGDMIDIAKDTKFTRSVKTVDSCKPQPVFHAFDEDKITSYPNEVNPDDISKQQYHGTECIDKKNPHEVDEHQEPSCALPQIDPDEVNDSAHVAEIELKTDTPVRPAIDSSLFNHHVDVIGRPPREDQEGRSSIRACGGSGTNQLRGAAGPRDQVRQNKGRSTLPSSDARRPGLRDMVCEDLQGFSKAIPQGVHCLRGAIHGAHGSQDCQGEWICLPQQYQDQQDSRKSSCGSDGLHVKGGSTLDGLQDGRGRGGLRLGCRNLCVGHQGRECEHPESPGPDGECHAAHDADPPADPSAAISSKELNADLWSQVANLTCLSETVFETQKINTNWVANEMWGYLKKKGFLDRDQRYIQKDACDLLEVYCSQDSQLTKQCLLNGGHAHRFGLKQGDLQYAESRFKLYDLLMSSIDLVTFGLPLDARLGVNGINSTCNCRPNLLRRSCEPGKRTRSTCFCVRPCMNFNAGVALKNISTWNNRVVPKCCLSLNCKRSMTT